MTHESPLRIEIHAVFSECLNYASWQNSVPLLKSLEIQNNSNETYENIRLELEISPGFCRPKHWRIQQLNSGGKLLLKDLIVQLDPDYLNGLNEAERGVASLQLYQENKLIGEAAQDLRVLARDEWGGMGSSGEMLAAFVMPNDPAIARILKKASEILATYGHSSALDGYQSGDPGRVWMLTAAIWSAIASQNLTYSNPPSSFEISGQKVRRPATVISDGLATCLDLTLLFASSIEAVGLNPIIVMTKGHCFAGVWLTEKTFNHLIEYDCSEIRKAIASNELITFETTLATHHPPARFEDAIATARDATQESHERDYVGSIDVKRARDAQIRPLASHEAHVVEPEHKPLSGPLPLPPKPDFKAPPVELSMEKPTTANGRIDRWQRKLLDLTMRNRLLNFKLTKQVVPLVCPDLSLIEDKLADGLKLKLISLPDEMSLGERDRDLFRQNTKRNMEVEFARQALEKNELSSSLPSDELSGRLTNVYRNVRNDLSEGGTNTLFLAVGFLKWKQKKDDEKSFRAPLLLVPVKLTRKSALSPFQLTHHEDEIRFNATLIQCNRSRSGEE